MAALAAFSRLCNSALTVFSTPNVSRRSASLRCEVLLAPFRPRLYLPRHRSSHLVLLCPIDTIKQQFFQPPIPLSKRASILKMLSRFPSPFSSPNYLFCHPVALPSNSGVFSETLPFTVIRHQSDLIGFPFFSRFFAMSQISPPPPPRIPFSS